MNEQPQNITTDEVKVILNEFTSETADKIFLGLIMIDEVEKKKKWHGESCAEYVLGRMNYNNPNWKEEGYKIRKLSECVTNSTFPEDQYYIDNFELMCEMLGQDPDIECDKIIQSLLDKVDDEK